MKGFIVLTPFRPLLQIEGIFRVDTGLEWAVGVVTFLAHLVSLGMRKSAPLPWFRRF